MHDPCCNLFFLFLFGRMPPSCITEASSGCRYSLFFTGKEPWEKWAQTGRSIPFAEFGPSAASDNYHNAGAAFRILAFSKHWFIWICYISVVFVFIRALVEYLFLFASCMFGLGLSIRWMPLFSYSNLSYSFVHSWHIYSALRFMFRIGLKHWTFIPL
jgi:hypothetical protein